MKKRKKKIIVIIGILLISLIVISSVSYFMFRSEWKFREDRPIKVLWVNSYHDFFWPEEQFKGFLSGLDVSEEKLEIKIFDMDTKRNADQTWREEKGKEARDLIDSWKPDLIYATDDNAQEQVLMYHLNTDMPLFFSGVNKEPEDYNFDNADNVAGVLERLHFAQVIDLLKQLYPGVRKIAIISDTGPTWTGPLEQIREQQKDFPDLEFVGWDLPVTFEEYKNNVKGYQTTADAILLLGVETFVDEHGENVPRIDVLKWTTENSNIPEVSFWEDRAEEGILASVAISAFEQGKDAGKLAREVLINGKNPSSFEFEPTKKGIRIIHLKRADNLDLEIQSFILINSKVHEEFLWEGA